MPEIEYVWDELGDNVIEEYEDSVLSVSYDHEPGLYGNLLSQNRNGVTSYYHYDGRGDTVALTDDSGNVTDTKEYDAWGNVIASTGSTVTPYLFRGRQEGQTTTGGVLIQARIYQPSKGLWLNSRSQANYISRQTSAGETVDPVKRIAVFPVSCRGDFWWKYSRGNDDSFASRPWNGNFQTAIICLELDIVTNCRIPGYIENANPPQDRRDRCCLGRIDSTIRYRAVQTGFVYPDLPPYISNGTAYAFHHDTFTAYGGLGCDPSSARLQLNVRNPPKNGSNAPWGQGSSLTAAFNCHSKCFPLSQEFDFDVHRDADSGIFSKGRLLQTFVLGHNRTKCDDKHPIGYSRITHYQNSPQHRADDMLRLVQVSPSVGFTGPLQSPHEPQPDYPQP